MDVEKFTKSKLILGCSSMASLMAQVEIDEIVELTVAGGVIHIANTLGDVPEVERPAMFRIMKAEIERACEAYEKPKTKGLSFN